MVLLTLSVGREEVNNLDARDKDLLGLALLREERRRTVNGRLL